MFNLFNNNRKTVVINFDRNVRMTVEPVCGGAYATIIEIHGVFERRERAFFATCDELVKSLKLDDADIIGKLAKAF